MKPPRSKKGNRSGCKHGRAIMQREAHILKAECATRREDINRNPPSQIFQIQDNTPNWPGLLGNLETVYKLTQIEAELGVRKSLKGSEILQF